MKHFYNFNAAIAAQPVTEAFGRAFGNNARNFVTITLISIFMLLGVESYGQVGTTFTAAESGNWRTIAWTKTGATTTNNYPQAGAIVIINGERNVVVTGEEACAELRINSRQNNGNDLGAGNIEIQAGGILNIGSLISAPKAGFAQAKMLIKNTGRLNITGLIDMGTSTTWTGYTFESNSNVAYIGNTATQAVYPLNYQNLILSGNGSAKTVTSGLNITGALLIESGTTFNAGTFSHSIGNGLTINGTFNAGGGVHTITGNITNSGTLDAQSSTIKLTGNYSGTGTFTKSTSTFIYTGANQDVAALDYHTLEFAGTGLKTAQGDIHVSGNLISSNGDNFVANNKQVVLNGINQDVAGFQFYKLAFNGSGTKRALGNIRVSETFITSPSISFNHNNQIFTYNGIAQAIMPLTYYDLLIAGAIGNVATNIPFVMGDINIVNTIEVVNARLVTGDKVIKLGSAANITSQENANQHIKGIVEATRMVGPGATQTFGNIGFRILGSGTDLGSVKVKRETGKPFKSPVNGNESANRQFYVSSEGGLPLNGLNATIDMNFPSYDLTSLPGAANNNIYRHTVESNKDIIELLANGAVDPTYEYRVANAQKFGMYTISSNIAPLPVELVWFKAERQAQGVNLTWLTASEKDNSGFEVQMSADGKKFSKIGFVKSTVTTSSVAQRYSFLDKSMASGTRYYRLAQIDLDGTTTYSNVKAVNVDNIKVAIAAFPNPFAGEVTVQLPTGAQREVQVILTNAFGQLLSEQNTEASEMGQVTVDMSSAKTSGMYILQVLDNGSKHTFKLMKR